MARKKVRIGELLVEGRVISEAQLQSALAEQKKSGLKLGRQLIEAGYVDEDRFLEFLSQQLDIPLVDLAHYETRSNVVELLPETYARKTNRYETYQEVHPGIGERGLGVRKEAMHL